MANQREPRDFNRIRAIAAQTRSLAIESQLAIALTLCATAESQIHLGQIDEARTVIQNLLHKAELIGCHLDEPCHVPAVSLPDLRERLAKLKDRIRDVEKQLHS